MNRSPLTIGAAFMAGAAAPFAAATPGHAQTAEAASFVAMDEISVPIVDAPRIDGVLRVSIMLQAHDADAAANLYRRMPELRAASLAGTIEFARLHASPFTPVDVRKLAATLTPLLLSVEPGIARVLIVKVSALTA